MAQNQDKGQKEIEKLKKGDAARTLMHADVGNEVISRLNALSNAQVSPARFGKFTLADGNHTLDLTQLEQLMGGTFEFIACVHDQETGDVEARLLRGSIVDAGSYSEP